MRTVHNPSSVRAVPNTYSGIYSHAVEIANPGKILTISGQIGLDVEGQVAQGFVAQCQQAMDNVELILAEAGMRKSDILRITYYLTDAGHLPDLTALRKTRWAVDAPPAITTLVVSALASPELLIEIEVFAARA